MPLLAFVHTWVLNVAVASPQGSGATTIAWIAAAAALIVGAATVAANLWIAREQRRDAAKQPALEQSVALVQERDGRIRLAVEAVETIRIRCWEISSVCRDRDCRAQTDLATRLGLQTDRLTADAQSLRQFLGAASPRSLRKRARSPAFRPHPLP